MERCAFVPSAYSTSMHKRFGEASTFDYPVPASDLSEGLLDAIVTHSDMSISYH